MLILKLFTFEYSFFDWEKSGTLEKEIEIYKKLEKEGCTFIFLTYGDIKDKEYEKLFQHSKIIPIYTLIKFKKNKFLRIFQSFYIPFAVKNKIRGVDLIKQNQLQGAWVSIILKLILGCPLLIRTGYDVYTFSKSMKKNFLKRFLYYLLTHVCLIFSDLYTVTSNSDKNYLINNFYFKKNIKLRRNSVNAVDGKPIKNRKVEIISVGRLEEQKNYKFLLNEMSNLDITLNIYGEGSQRKSLIDYAKYKNTNTVFHGIINNYDLNKKLSECVFYIIPSLYEGNPKSLIEAMANGCIVLASDIPNHVEIVDNNKNGFLFKLENGELRKTFLDIQNLDLDKISENARLSIKNNFSLDKLVNLELKDYKDLIDLK